LAQQTPAPVPAAGPSGPVNRYPTRFVVADAPEHFDQVLMVIDFPPGSWTPAHMPGGNVYNTVIDGAVSIRPMGTTSAATYEAGATFVANAGEYVEVGNSGDVGARMISTTILPRDAILTTYADDARQLNADSAARPRMTTLLGETPRPTVVGQGSISVDRPSRVFELMQMLVDFEPGTWTATHTHGGYDLSMVATGALRLERVGEVQTLELGQAFVNAPGVFHRVGNESDAFAQATATFLVPQGATLTTVQPSAVPVVTPQPTP
jgi:quercetin dioxygenase-like cupin family protein